MQASEEEFAEWLGHPVTEEIFKLLSSWADRQANAFTEHAWGKRAVTADEKEELAALLREARIRHDCYRVMSECSYEDWREIEDKLNDSKS